MLELINIKKEYQMQDETVHALKGVSLKFRQTEFVPILGQSGCGKTTLLNIVGGLDKYTSGDLIINGISTKDYSDRDWDTYRNHKIGFIFQSYNLIPHLTVLENVELALTLSGISKDERRVKAKAVLEKVGLADKLKNKPNQLSGGQMQRVAIARALVNDPDIILADEPTGALDSKTSIQIMDILKSISNEKLIIMVTHNPELAEQYSSRIIKLLDGNILSDSNPISQEDLQNLNDNANEETEEKVEVAEEKEVDVNEILRKKKKVKKEKTRMSFFTALSLSFKNLLTKKARTFLVSFAGSIGIIGIALILSLSSGFQAYVDMVQKDTLSSYPIELNNSSYDMASLMQIFLDDSSKGDNSRDDDKIYTKNELTDMLEKFNASSSVSDLKSFRAYIEGDAKEELNKYVSAVQYGYNINVNAYLDSSENGIVSSNLTTVFADIITEYGKEHSADLMSDYDKSMRYGILNMMFGSESSFFSNAFWSEMLDNQDLLKSQYELVGEGSKWATESNEIMIVVDEDNQISDYTLFGLGLIDQSGLETLLDDYINDRDSTPINKTFEFSDLLGLEYKYILEADFYESNGDGYKDIRTLKTTNPTEYENKLEQIYENAIPLKVAGIIKPKAEASALSIKTCIAYTSALTKEIIERGNSHSLVMEQKNNPTFNIIQNKPFDAGKEEVQLASNLASLGYSEIDNPTSIMLYPINFEAKKGIEEVINKYNNMQLEAGNEDKLITYTDAIGTMMSSVSTIISSVTYVLIAFVSISLIVSSIMIGIITYISVLERIKEIGVLRSLGASRRDIKRVFVSESAIIGLIAGILGIAVTLILTIPINIIIYSLAGLSNIASLPIVGGVVLIVISVLLTFIAGLIPAKIASKKDPVIALRTE